MDRRFGSLLVRIDETLCVGFGDCITGAETVFELDDDGVVRFCTTAPERVARDVLETACRACPVDALSLIDAHGVQLAP